MDKEKFFQKFKWEGLTFDDVLLSPNYSRVLPRQVNTGTWITRNLKIEIPLISAAMDTVTTSALAIAMARQGGLGVIHKNFSIVNQAFEVEKVKRYQSNIVTKPFSLLPDDTVADALKLKEQHNFSTFPIVDAKGIFLGLATKHDLTFYTDDEKEKLVNVMQPLENLRVAYETDGLDIEGFKALLKKYRVQRLPILKSPSEPILVGILFQKDVDNKKRFPLASVDSKNRLLAGAAVGVTADIIDRIGSLVDAGVDVVTIDTAHAHSWGAIDAIKKARKNFKHLELVGGNIATAQAAKALIAAGVNALKVGIGPGSICTTRIVAGIGVPQLTAIYEVSQIAKYAGIPVIGDGGLRYSGDIVKAIAAGADTVMAGGMFAGTDESPGEMITYEGRKFKSYRGMGSLEAMQDGSKDRYFQDMESDIKKLVPEGVVGRVPYVGSVESVVTQMIGGLRAGMGYCGAKDIIALQNNTKFIRITSAGMKESHPHDLTITQEAPNYSSKK